MCVSPPPTSSSSAFAMTTMPPEQPRSSEVKIPSATTAATTAASATTAISTTTTTTTSGEYPGTSCSSNIITQQLEENDVFGSRASSVTVMSENDRHSLMSPFASPVNQGMDTPIVRPHPFRIRTTPLVASPSGSSSDARRVVSAPSETDSIDSFYVARGSDTICNTSLRSLRKSDRGSIGRSSDLSTSQTSHSSMKKQHSPSVSSDHVIMSSDHVTGTDSSRQPATHCEEEGEHYRCNCHFGHRNTCALLASCESMGMCPIEDGFMTFEPIIKSKNGGGSDGMTVTNLSCGACWDPDQYSLSHLASCGLLGPPPPSSLDSTSSSSNLAPPSSRISCSSWDSGYDQSLSLTNSSRDSCPEFAGSFIMVGSNKNAPISSCSGEGAKCICSECDSGRGSQCSCFKEKVHHRQLFLPGSMGQETTPTAVNILAHKRSLLPNSLGQDYTNHKHHSKLGCTVLSPHQQCMVSDSSNICADSSKIAATVCNMNGRSKYNNSHRNGSRYPQDLSDLSLKSPPDLASPDDPTRALRPMKLKNYTAPSHMHQTELPSPLSPNSVGNQLDLDEGRCNPIMPVSSDPLHSLPPHKSRKHHQACSTAANKSESLCSIPASSFPHEYTTTGSIPAASQTGGTVPFRPSSSASCSGGISLCQDHRADIAASASKFSTALEAQSTCGSSCCEVDSGCGTKSSPRTTDFDTHSLSQISELSLFGPGEELGCLNDDEDDSYVRSASACMVRQSSPTLSLIGCGRSTECLNSSNGICCLEEEETSRDGGVKSSQPHLFKPHEQQGNTRSSGNSKHSQLSSRNFSVLHQQLHKHERSVQLGVRPSTLKQFEDFTDVPLPDLEEFHLDTSSSRVEMSAHYYQMSDFGHSLFVG